MKVSLTKNQNLLRIILGSLMLVAGIGHLTFQREIFTAQVPPWLTQDKNWMDLVVIVSGIIEVLLGLAMLIKHKYLSYVGLALAVFYVLIFPGNISQYTNQINAFGLDTDMKRLIRLFFQPVLILWALWSTGTLTQIINKKNQHEHKI